MSTGANAGDAKPLSDLVGLVLMTVIDSPSLSFPPTNSLPPRLWPPRLGIVRGDAGEPGDRGGLINELAGSEGALELKLNSGRGGDRSR